VARLFFESPVSKTLKITDSQKKMRRISLQMMFVHALDSEMNWSDDARR
jgi:hypothetical protein